VGAYGFGEPVEGEEMAYAVETLNKMVKEWATLDIFLWQLNTLTISSTADIATLPLQSSPPILSLDAARIITSVAEEPLEIISWREYEALPEKTTKGDSRVISLNRALTGQVHIYPVPTVARVFKLRVVAPMKDWDTTTETGEMPSHWALALEYGLANILSDLYKTPVTERALIGQKADYYFMRAKGSNRLRGDRTVVRGAY